VKTWVPEDGEGTKLNSEDEELALVGLSLTYSFILNTYNIITVTGKYNIYNTRALSFTRFPSVFQASIQRLRSTKAQIFLQALFQRVQDSFTNVEVKNFTYIGW